VGYFLASVMGGIWLGATGDDELSLAGQGLSQLGLWVGLVGAPLYAARRKGSGRLSVDFGLRFRPIDPVIGLVAGLASQFLIVPLVAVILGPLLGDPDVSEAARDLVEGASGWVLVFLVLAVAVITPVVEELFFRGLLLRAVQRRWSTVWAVGASSVVFGLVHLNQPDLGALVLAMASLSVFAVLLALLTVRTGRLGPAIIAHAVFNGWTLLWILAISPTR
jgi:membrane protease YdiL (CAAX protease family)